MNKQLVSTSKFLSLVLRHQPDVIGLQLDDQGWLDINALIENANARGNPITLEWLHEVVATNDKQRFALSDDGLRIRASQGHSVASVDLQLTAVTPPDVLFHGTVARSIPSIRKTGLDKRSGNHVHLSAEQKTATNVGSRRGKPVVLTITSMQMHQAGYEFFLSDNEVWLTETVPVEFILFPNDATPGDNN